MHTGFTSSSVDVFVLSCPTSVTCLHIQNRQQLVWLSKVSPHSLQQAHNGFQLGNHPACLFVTSLWYALMCVVTFCRRPKARAPDPRRQAKHVRHERRRGGFSDLSSDDPDGGVFMGGHWSRLVGLCV
jgi:hypothetical protein